MIYKPNLAKYYSRACQEVYGIYVSVPRGAYGRFADVEAKLMRKGISPKHFAYTMAKLWKDWCAKKNIKAVPINVFLGEKSQHWYDGYALFAVDVVDPSFVRAKVANDEFTLASMIVRNVVAGNYVHESDVIDALNLSNYWHDAEEAGTRPTVSTAEIVAKICGVECTTTNYTRLGELIRARTRQQVCLE